MPILHVFGGRKDSFLLGIYTLSLGIGGCLALEDAATQLSKVQWS